MNIDLSYEDLLLNPPEYKYGTVEEYSDELVQNRIEQKQLLKDNKILTNQDIRIQGDKSTGSRLLKDMSAMMLTSFNVQCENIINKTTYKNYMAINEKIYNTANKINSQGALFNLQLPPRLIELKIQEFKLVYEKARLARKKEEEEKCQKQLLKEQQNTELYLMRKLDNLEQKKEKMLKQSKGAYTDDIENLDDIIEQYKRRLSEQKSGYVYIISNPAFGKDIYKIGLTRRPDYMTRIDELHNASVPFRFNIHCVLFSEDAFALETALHHEFDIYRVNKENIHKEYFQLPLEEIQRVVLEKYDSTAQFNFHPEENNA